MKIIVNNKIIDTQNIYSISEIEEQQPYGDFCFTIESFNDKSECIEAKRPTPNDFRNEDRKKMFADFNNAIEDTRNKLEKLRQDVIKIWTENQSTLPTFDIKNY